MKAIIFDAYGTLICTGNGSVEASKKLLQKLKSEIAPEEFYKDWKQIHKKNIMNLQMFKSEESIFVEDLYELYKIYRLEGNPVEDVQFMLCTLGKRKVYEDTLEVLEGLSEKYKLYIGSTTDSKPLKEDLQRNNMKVHGVFTSETLQVYKPNKFFYRKILSEIKCKSSEVVFVGDSIYDDIMGPKTEDIVSVLIDRKNQYGNSEHDITPDYIIKSLSELYRILEIIEGELI